MGRLGKEPIRAQHFKFQPIREPYLAHVTSFTVRLFLRSGTEFWVLGRARSGMGSRLGAEMTSRDRK